MLNYLGLWWVKAVVIGALVAAVGWAGYQAGYDRCFRKLSQEAASLRLELAGIEQRRLKDTADLSEKNRQVERRYSALVADTDKRLMEVLRRENDKRDNAVANIRLGTTSLFIPVAKTGCSTSGVTDPTRGADGADRAQLSGEAAEFLVGLAAEADACAVKLTAAQDFIRGERTIDKLTR